MTLKARSVPSLAAVLKADGPVEIARAAGLEPRLGRVAAAGRPVAARHFLKLCGAAGVDPETGRAIARRQVGDLMPGFLGKGVRLRREVDKEGLRKVAARLRLSPATMSRLENGRVVSLAAVLAACRYLGVHPFEATEVLDAGRRIVSRETSTETRGERS